MAEPTSFWNTNAGGSVAGGLVSGGLSLVGGLFGGKSKGPKRKHIRMQYEEANRNIPLQAQAYKDAGIHPLYGFGGQSFQPTVTSGGDSGVDLSGFGQNVGRAVQSYLTKDERAKQQTLDALQIENMAAQNDLLRAQTTSVLRNSAPGLPSSDLQVLDGQGESTQVPVNVFGQDSDRSKDISLSQTTGGRYAVVPSEGTKQKIEDMLIPEIQWYLRQALSDAPDGYAYNPLTSEYFPTNERSIQGFIARLRRSGKF